MSNQVIGQARVKVDSDALETDGSLTLEIGGPKREAVTGDYQAGAFKETTEPAKLTCKILVKAGTSLSDYRRIKNATLTVEFDTGQTWLIRGAYLGDLISVGQSDGKADLVFMGEPAEEVL